MFVFGILLLLLTRFRLYESKLKSFSDSTVKASELFYNYPDQPTAYPNMTIAVIYDFVGEFGTMAYYQSVKNVMTMVCGIENYNQGVGKFSPKGVFNTLIMQTASAKAQHAYTMVEQVLGQNLYFRANGSSFGAVKNTPINAIVRMATVKDLGSDVPVLAGVSLPSINFATELFYYSFINYPLLVSNKYDDNGALLVSQPSPALISIYLLELAKHFKWQMVGAIFSADIIGFFGQNAFQDISFALRNYSGTFAPCITVLDSKKPRASYQDDLKNFSNCINNANKIRVIIVWMESNEAIFATEQFLKIAGTNKGFLFLYPGLADGARLAKDAEGSMFLIPNTNVSNSKDHFKCSDKAKQQLFNILGTEAVDSATKFLGNCTITNPALPVCDSLLGDALGNCSCSSDQIYYSSVAADSVDLLMHSIENMQTNCTLLNKCIELYYSEFKTDYCSKKTFNGADLFYATKCSPFYGNTGDVRFSNNSNLRQTYPMKVFQVQPDRKIQNVADFINGTLIIYDNLYFQSGEPPVSAIVVSDPNLSDAYVVVFFVIDLLLMVITLGLIAFVIVYRKNRVIRNSGLSSNLVILLGLFFVELSVVFMCFSLNPAFCRLMDTFMLVGVSFIISTLAAKLYRIYRIFQNPTAQPVHITDRDLLIFTCGITLGTVILFVLYDTLGGGLRAVTKIASSNILYRYLICEVPDSAIQMIFLISFYVYFVFLFVAAGILAFLTRKTMLDFNESIHVSSVVYSWLTVALIYAPLYYVQGTSTDSNQTRYVVRFIAIDLVIILTLGILYWQKVQKVLRLERLNKIRRRTMSGY